MKPQGRGLGHQHGQQGGKMRNMETEMGRGTGRCQHVLVKHSDNPESSLLTVTSSACSFVVGVRGRQSLRKKKFTSILKIV